MSKSKAVASLTPARGITTSFMWFVCKEDAPDVNAAGEEKEGLGHDAHLAVLCQLQAHGTGAHVLLGIRTVQTQVAAPTVVQSTAVC